MAASFFVVAIADVFPLQAQTSSAVGVDGTRNRFSVWGNLGDDIIFGTYRMCYPDGI